MGPGRLESLKNGYVTLSHRWGSAPFLQLNDDTKQDLEAGMPIMKLPATFRDAVSIAHRLDIQYLWIDSLCIKQDCHNDWLEEAPRMQHIYGGAAINIVAGHSNGPESGLFHARDSHLVESFITQAEWNDCPPQQYLIWNETEFKSDFTSAPLTRRGWVFQERLLAPRILQFSKMQMYWRCSELFACESWPFGASSSEQGYAVRYGPDLDDLELGPSSDITTLRDQRNQTRKWELLVMQYSACDLTKPQDKLIALSGVANLFRNVTGDQYVAGLWRSALPRLLCWERHIGNSDETQKARGARPAAYRAPSWSWASIDDPVSYPSREYHDILLLEDLIEITNVDIVAQGEGKTAQVSNGVLTVRGWLHPFKFLSRQGYYIKYKIGGDIRIGRHSEFIVDALLNENLEEMDLWVLPVRLAVSGCDRGYFAEVRGIVLKKQGDTGFYLRVGLLNDSYYGDEVDERARGNDVLGVHSYMSFQIPNERLFTFRRHLGECVTISIL
ncbi:hypothetical protein CDV31_009629 [Fusarium ambrosium]|uniref:Heterokaryon incompatibility domain-containing protein n=1 Tax=Fusarium ambrosium TaxID=131363 RepID=A0A428TTM1_9HYPO|nr:hypothetical protein CDV31_009629 [Fusarium ambrosium]